MRFDDWDVILFPTGRDSKVPFKEFKVACHVVPDVELAHSHGSIGMPVMTCFVPSLPAGTPFQISIHCWKNPEISQFTRTYSKHADLVKFEARIMIDGRLVASTAFDRKVNGPHLIASTFEFTKTGELERLKFPNFRRELLYQNHWNPGDDVGRIKIIISEGFPRDSLSVPIERVKNVVAFSFQHAPLDILESNGIAWPNPSMWRRPTFNPAMPVPTFHPEDGADSHTHSPRRKSTFLRSSKNQGFPAAAMTGGIFPSQAPSNFLGNPAFQMPCFPRGTNTSSPFSFNDPFAASDPAYINWVNALHGTQSSAELSGKTTWPTSVDLGDKATWSSNIRHSRQSNTDISMPDYVTVHSDPMQISGGSLEDDPMSLKVPTNTPTAGEDFQGTQYPLTHQSTLPSDLSVSLTHSLLNQPFLPIQTHNSPLLSSEIKSRKENRHLTVAVSNPSSAHSTPPTEHFETRKFSQPVFGPGAMASGNPMPSSASESTSVDSPSLRGVFSASGARNTPVSDFGSSITNVNANLNPLMESASNTLNMGLGSNSGGIKRTRNFTPASAKAIDEEDEPRRASPHVRVVGYGGEMANEGYGGDEANEG
ncbi:hypothetical protein B0T22DRAFT_182222 [Podospora appendiculata]|uniref:Uncharacterized protein n=1 Tax=Podospora appendiculata TaxID=314037 RepID=A0AAE0XCS7_9PEZI|nr:hypothetical protein B0T22DRAFT_182222 [Podospora appendiculata]